MSSSKGDIGVVLAVFLTAALSLLVVLRLLALLRPYDRLAWSPAPTFWGWLALSLAVLLLTVSLYRARGGFLAASLVLVAFVATAAAYLLHPGVLALLAAWALVIAVAILASRGRPRLTAAAVIMASVPLVLIVFLLALSVVLTRLPGGAETVVRSPSPDERWTAVTTTTDPGAMGSVSSTVVVSRDLVGLLQLRRTVYEGPAAKATWIRPSVLQLPGGPLDVVTDDADVQ